MLQRLKLRRLKYLYALPFFVLAVWVLILGAANIFAYQASKHEDKWYAAGRVEDKASWDDAISSLQTAMVLDPYNPDYPETIGKFYVWRYTIDNAPITTVEEASIIHKTGLEYLRQSVYQRPTSLQIHAVKKDLDEALEDIVLSLETRQSKKRAAAKKKIQKPKSLIFSKPLIFGD